MANTRLRLKIFGQVQGVNFRFYAKQEADQMGITGWVKNLSDGGVECLTEGEREMLDKFLNWCQHGPRGARVERVDVGWEEDTREGFKQFTIV